jgi:hypothetical protein
VVVETSQQAARETPTIDLSRTVEHIVHISILSRNSEPSERRIVNVYKGANAVKTFWRLIPNG